MSLMAEEIAQIPAVLRTQFQHHAPLLKTLAAQIHHFNPAFIVTIARGSSDHAATFARYLFETQLGLITASAAPSVYTLYKTPMHLKKALVIALSQSGASPDLCETLAAARQQGALTVALVNQVDSPLAKIAEWVIPLYAGPEHAVAATKSYVATLHALVQLSLALQSNAALQAALQQLPLHIAQSSPTLCEHLLSAYAKAQTTLITARGFGFPIALELALKFKEVTQIHAESFSSAEILHGPFSLFNQAFPVLVLTQNDATLPAVHTLIQQMHQTAVQPILVGDQTTLSPFPDLPQLCLPITHPILTPLLSVAALYPCIEALARSKGLNPDAPPLIQKITRTL